MNSMTMMTLQYNKVFCLSSPRDRCPDAFFIALSFFPLLIIPPLSLLSFLLSLHSFVILVRWMNSMTMMCVANAKRFLYCPFFPSLAYHPSFISPLIPPVSSSISRVVCTCVVACYAWGTKYCSQRRLNEWKYYLYWARNYYLLWVAWNWVINLRFVHPQKAAERNFFTQFHATHNK